MNWRTWCEQIGDQWRDVTDKMSRGRYQPLLLLYQRQHPPLISTHTAPKETTVVQNFVSRLSSEVHSKWLMLCSDILERTLVLLAFLRRETMLVRYMLWACVCLSVTSSCSTKTDKLRIKQATPHDSPGNLVFWRQISPWNSTEVNPCGGAKCRWGGLK